MKFVMARRSGFTLLLLGLTACSTVKDYFPDKEKDYQFGKEIAPLSVPPDLSGAGLEKRVARPQLADDTEKVAVMSEVVEAPAKNAVSPATPVVAEEEVNTAEPTVVDLIKFSNGAVRLHFNKPLATSVRLVAKALSRKTIEITQRDHANGEFTVQYDPNATDFTDDSFWSDIDFVFEKDHSQEKPFQLKLIEHAKMTEMAVLDSQGQPLADGDGLSLLKLLLTTLKADIATDAAK